MADRVAVLRGGELQQFDTPQRVYANPANLFVAVFIGSPAMNVLEGELTRGDGGVDCRIGPYRVPIPDKILAAEPALARSIGRTVAVGIRPEAISVVSGDGHGGLRGTVVVSEELGSEVISHVEVEAKSVRDEAIVEGLPTMPPTEAAPRPGGRPERKTVIVARLPAEADYRRGTPLACVRCAQAPFLRSRHRGDASRHATGRLAFVDRCAELLGDTTYVLDRGLLDKSDCAPAEPGARQAGPVATRDLAGCSREQIESRRAVPRNRPAGLHATRSSELRRLRGLLLVSAFAPASVRAFSDTTWRERRRIRPAARRARSSRASRSDGTPSFVAARAHASRRSLYADAGEAPLDVAVAHDDRHPGRDRDVPERQVAAVEEERVPRQGVRHCELIDDAALDTYELVLGAPTRDRQLRAGKVRERAPDGNLQCR